MTEYLTTKEVAKYLKLNEKKVYSLVSEGKMPAARISGKWLFPRHLIDQWVQKNVIHPAGGLLAAALDEMLVIQGSDDWLFSKVVKHFRSTSDIPVVSSPTGSLAGLTAVGEGKAHLACFHTEMAQAKKLTRASGGCYFLSLYARHQGLIFDGKRQQPFSQISQLADRNPKFAIRQPLSGTYQLTKRLFDEQGFTLSELTHVGPFSTHLELAHAIQKGRADVGIGVKVAAQMCELDFVPLHEETFKLAVPTEFTAHPRMSAFLAFVLDELKAIAQDGGASSYNFTDLGRVEIIGQAKTKDTTGR